MPTLVLASASPQRRELLTSLGAEFTVVHSSVDEEAVPEADPRVRPVLLSQLKARDVAAKHPQAWVIGCDTIVVGPDGSLLEKPRDVHEAEKMIRLQSGATSVVHSGLTLIAPDGRSESALSSSSVTFTALSESDVAWWLTTKLWQGRSGAFQIDGPGQLMIANISGDWTSIVGLPVYLLGQLAHKLGLKLIS
jgi:septum formation protein